MTCAASASAERADYIWEPVHVEIWSDIACPWCYVGKRRFEAAVAAFEERDDVQVTWRSFELDPQAPRERDVDSATHLAEKYGMTREEAQASQQNLASVAAGDGLDMRFDLARDVLASDRYAAEVRKDESTAMELGISAVPFFVVDRRMGAAGAHPPEALLELLRRGVEAQSAA